MFAMSLKLTLFSLVDAYASPYLVESCKCVEGDTYAKLKPLLEGIYILDCPFQFLDIESRCIINCKLEGSIGFLRMYMFYH